MAAPCGKTHPGLQVAGGMAQCLWRPLRLSGVPSVVAGPVRPPIASPHPPTLRARPVAGGGVGGVGKTGSLALPPARARNDPGVDSGRRRGLAPLLERESGDALAASQR